MNTDTPMLYDLIENRPADMYDADGGPTEELGRALTIAKRERAELIEALKECITETPGAACYNTGRKTRRLEAISELARAVLSRMVQP